jgi:hypothetical protein
MGHPVSCCFDATEKDVTPGGTPIQGAGKDKDEIQGSFTAFRMTTSKEKKWEKKWGRSILDLV